MTDVPDLEVGRLALRTFKIEDQRLKSLYKEHYWDGGKAVAVCTYTRNVPGHKVVDEDCSCGLYGTLTIEQLFREYGSRAHRCVAVIAAEGTTVIGPKGLRTAAARIIAYWTTDHYALAALKAQCSEAKHYNTLSEMLTAHGFDATHSEEWTQAWLPAHAPGLASRGSRGWGKNQAFWSASGGYAPGSAGGGGGGSISRVTVTGGTSVTLNAQSCWDNITGPLPAITPAGADAIRHALGLPTTKDTT